MFIDQPEFRICQCEILNPPVALMVGYGHVACSICFQMFAAAYSCLKRGLFWSIEYCCVLNLTLPSLKAFEVPVDVWGGERKKHLKTTEL